MSEYKQCQLLNSTCGPYKPRNEHGIFLLSSLTEDVSSLCGSTNVLTEMELICDRSTQPLDSNKYICAFHKYSLGNNWRSPSICKSPIHEENIKNSKVIKVSYNKLYEIKQKFSNFYFPINSKICRKCYQILVFDKNIIYEAENQSIEDKDIDWVPPVLIFDEDNAKNLKEKLDKLTNLLGMERIKFQINSGIESISDSTVWYFKNYLDQLIDTTRNLFFDCVAPGQSDFLKEKLTKPEKNEHIPSELEHLVKCYKSCVTNESKISLLALVPTSYRKEYIANIFGTNLYKITEARRRLSDVSSFTKMKPKVLNRFRINSEQVSHFIEWLFTSGLLKEEAYGTTNLKFESGEKMLITNTILDGVHEHVCREYLIYCSEVGYSCLGKTSLKNILKAIKPKTRQRVAGVDSFVVEGYAAFEDLHQCINILTDEGIKKKAHEQVDNGKNYFKTRYHFHCTIDNGCASHCISHALSHPQENKLQKLCKVPHSNICPECYDILNTVNIIENNISLLKDSHEKDTTMFKFLHAKQKIFDWQNHIIRAAQQGKARTTVMDILESRQALWIRDWAEKILPSRNLESMTEYFGKRGFSLSVEVFLIKNEEKWQKFVYFVALDRCEQELLDCLSIADIVLQQFSHDNPLIKQLHLKSDNAGCYHANGTAEGIYNICQKYHIQLLDIHFNEAQKVLL
ncbi:unnamed protein product [Brassicogethes aeneus]|uniref:Uncharacterized protein n=1 Tax=Brassicogethes aeneus TaxID=1431903 RepID=A0A9P0ANM7_BRAAE|nr:unnamed protein product [Brassicogethes aeneus]